MLTDVLTVDDGKSAAVWLSKALRDPVTIHSLVGNDEQHGTYPTAVSKTRVSTYH